VGNQSNGIRQLQLCVRGPCQFNVLPTHGHCEASGAFHIDERYFGDVKLDGMTMGGIFQWPGPIHEGRGKCQPFVDERANEKQREALLKVLSRCWLKAADVCNEGFGQAAAVTARHVLIASLRNWRSVLRQIR
jgi:hypothetical protein